MNVPLARLSERNSISANKPVPTHLSATSFHMSHMHIAYLPMYLLQFKARWAFQPCMAFHEAENCGVKHLSALGQVGRKLAYDAVGAAASQSVPDNFAMVTSEKDKPFPPLSTVSTYTTIAQSLTYPLDWNNAMGGTSSSFLNLRKLHFRRFSTAAVAGFRFRGSFLCSLSV